MEVKKSMKRYVGMVYIGAKPMCRGTYNDLRGWNIPTDENPMDEGYIVQQPGGNITWYPKAELEEVYKDVMGSNLNFSQALDLVKSGICLGMARKGWNGKDMMVVYQKGYPEGIPCNKNTAEAWGLNEGDLFKCRPYLQLRCADGTHAMWSPSGSDVICEDWMLVFSDEQYNKMKDMEV